MLACVICWQLSACEKVVPDRETPAGVFGITAAAFPPETDFIAGCELDPARPDRLHQLVVERIPDPTSVCGRNPFERIRAIAVGADYVAGAAFVALRGIDRRELTSCLYELGSQPVDQGRITSVMLNGRSEPFGWISDDVLIVAVRVAPDGTGSLDGALLEERMASAKGLAEDAPLLRLLGPRQGAQCLAASTSTRLTNDLGSAFTGLVSLSGRLRHLDRPDSDRGVVFDEIDATFNLRFATAAQGEAASRGVPAAIRASSSVVPAEVLAAIAEMAEVSRSGTEVRVRLTIDQPRFRALEQAIMTAAGGPPAAR